MMRTTGILCALVLAACSWGNSDPNGGGHGADAATAPVCGDGVCAASEVNSCMQDCGGNGSNNNNPVCGNGQCETTKGETAKSCPSDCMTGNGSGSGSGMGMCPTDPTTCLSCIFDPTMCPAGLDQNACIQCAFGSGLGSGLGSGMGSGNCNFNLTCDAGETNATCPTDCP